MLLINSKFNLISTWFEIWVLIFGAPANQVPTFAITDTKLYVPAVPLSTQGSPKLLAPLKSGFKRTIYRNKYQSKVTVQTRLIT